MRPPGQGPCGEEAPRAVFTVSLPFIYVEQRQPEKGVFSLGAVFFHCFLVRLILFSAAWAGRQQRWGLQQIRRSWYLEGRGASRAQVHSSLVCQECHPGKTLVPGLSGWPLVWYAGSDPRNWIRRPCFAPPHPLCPTVLTLVAHFHGCLLPAFPQEAEHSGSKRQRAPQSQLRCLHE